MNELQSIIDAIREHNTLEPSPGAPLRLWHLWRRKTEALRRQAMVEVIKLASCQE